MGEEPGTGGPGVSGPGDAEQIREEIEATREELGDTIEALAEKTDVKAQARQKAEETKASITEKKDDLLGKAREASPESAVSAANQASQKARENPLPIAAVGAFALGFVLGRVSAR
jgi:ElaB/YqjD/DUF883 family membrane-anchored ribosome-binding protein